MIQRYNNLSFMLFIPGILAQGAGYMMRNRAGTESAAGLSLMLLLGGSALAISGLACYALAKGRSPLWGAAGIFGLPGIIVLALLKDNSGDNWNT